MATTAKFSIDQARRIAATVQAHERSIPDRTGGEEPRQQLQVPHPAFMVRVTIDGGAAGSATQNCTFTYRVETLAGVVLGDNLTPLLRRFPLAVYTVTPPGSVGIAFRDEVGELNLYDANELVAWIVC